MIPTIGKRKPSVPPAEIEFEVDDSANEPPPELLEQLGDAMKSDVFEGKAMEIVTKPVEDDEEDSVDSPSRWADSRMVDLARGVPLSTLQEDSFKIRGQNFVCLSFVFGDQYRVLHCGKTTYRGDLIKVRGVFKTRENADRYIRDVLMKEDPHSRVILAKMFSWTTLEDDAEDNDGLEVGETDKIENALRGYFENENERIQGIQRRIDMTKSWNKGRAKETSQFFFQSLEERKKAEEEKKAAREFYEKNKDKEMTMDDLARAPVEGPFLVRLADDKTHFPHQKWCCVSYIRPDEYRSTHFPNEELKRPIIKVRGVFATRREAEVHIRQHIQALDPHVDVSLVPCGQWAGLEDDSVEDREYMDTFDNRENLRDAIMGYLENKNDQITAIPQDRVRAAAAASDTAYDASLIPSQMRLNGDASSPKQLESGLEAEVPGWEEHTGPGDSEQSEESEGGPKETESDSVVAPVVVAADESATGSQDGEVTVMGIEMQPSAAKKRPVLTRLGS